MALGFVESRLLDCVSYGTAGGPTWKTRKVMLRSGINRRNPQRVRPLYRFALIYRNLLPDDHQEVYNAFNACMGGVYGFRLKDWLDFEADAELLPVLGTGAPQNTQLIKTYSFGGNSITREIRKPVAGTVIITANNVPIAATINTATGVATYTAGLGTVVRWSGEFDVPVTFTDDELQFAANDRNPAAGLFLTADVSLEEDLGE